MILFELTENEDHPVYQNLAISNGKRQYDFLNSVILSALDIDKKFLSQVIIRSFNYHAITCLHVNAREYRPCAVYVRNYQPPEFYRVQALMDDFVNVVNRYWETTDAVTLAAYVLWRLNHIHPFINGNGRTARAACYFVLCLKSGGLLPGSPILPELITRSRLEYEAALEAADASAKETLYNLEPLHTLLGRLIGEQLASSESSRPTAPPPTPPFAPVPVPP